MKFDRIILMGSPDFSIPAFNAIYHAYPNQVCAVFSQPPRPKGRSSVLQPTPVSSWAQHLGIPVYTPQTKAEVAESIFNLAPSLVVVIAYGMILPESITDHVYCVNIHASLLPLYRGPSPIHAAILNRDSQTGVTLMRLNSRMDAGNILAQSQCLLTADDHFQAVHDRLSEMGATLCLQWLNNLISDDKMPTGVTQIESDATYCKKITPNDTVLNPALTSPEMLASIRAFSPQPGATWIQNGKRIKILDARLTADQKLVILTVKPEGKSAMSYSDYLLGHPEGLSLC